ncbi:DUF1127 domain-containing protein [Azospirillum sp. SYSU D00513]|uniref:DUF1127 domain-containing protein n=1 Tax=Azospirillum sp. SYSU D00513 TaxID=2812561 RepID=UPI001A96B768|nr:DUF1127 domain-containing protein [Azospirillum sp. SYSU D00513]
MRTTETTHSRGAALTAGTATRAVAGTVQVRIVTAIFRPLWILIELVMSVHERWRQRQHLMMLDDHLLKDIGLSRADADQETSKPFWKE